jgi:hypothetical protein
MLVNVVPAELDRVDERIAGGSGDRSHVPRCDEGATNRSQRGQPRRIRPGTPGLTAS